MSRNTPTQQIEREIDNAYGEIELSQKPLSKFLRELDLQPLREKVMSHYTDSRGKSRKYKPTAMAYTLIFKELRQLDSRRQVLRRLKRNLNEAKDLGYTLENGVPAVQNLGYFINDKMSQETLELIQHTAEYIREKDDGQAKIQGVEQVETEEEDEKSWKEQVKDKKFQEVSNFLQWKVFPRINFGRADNNKYEDVELLDFLTFTAMRNVCTTEGYNLLSEMVDKDIPHADTVLHHVRELERNEIYEMYESANQRILELAEEEGRLDKPVDVAIDFTNIQYYGDKNDDMVVEVKPKDGTSHAYKFATIKIVSEGEHYTLKALPVNKFSGKRDIVEELLDHAEKHVEIRRVYADRGFFSGEIINLFEEKDLKFIMPAVRNSKVKQFLEEEDAPAVVRYTMKGKETSTFNIAIKKPRDEEDPKPFATNCTQLEILTQNLFRLYSRRWRIETEYESIADQSLDELRDETPKVKTEPKQKKIQTR